MKPGETMVRLQGYAFAAVAALLWSFVYPLSRYCMEEGVPPLEMAFWRVFLGGAAFLAYAAARGETSVPRRLLAMLLAFGVVGVAGHFAIVFLAIEGCGVAMSAILMYTAPPLVALFSWLFLRERMGLAFTCALAVSLCGIVLVSLSGGGLTGGATTLGLASGILCGVVYALHFMVVKYLLGFCTPAALYGYAFAAAALVYLPFVPFVAKPPLVWASLAGMALVSTFCAFLLYGRALSLLRSSQVAAIVNLDPVFSTVWAFMFFSEVLSLMGTLGAALVMTGVGLSILGNSKPAEPRIAGA